MSEADAGRPARTVLGTTLGTIMVCGAAWFAFAARGARAALGAPVGELRAGAPEGFHNPEPAHGSTPGPILRALLTRRGTGRPARPVPLAPVTIPASAAPLAVTWFGHSSALIEIDGRRVLVDPMWGERASPSRTVGPRRLHPVPAPLASLPPVDAVLLSHDHYDHLDLPTIRALGRDSRAPFVVPTGIGAHLRRWGVPPERIVELGWGGSAGIAGLALHCAQARHFSGRGLARDTTLWSSWAVVGPRHRAYFGGDTGYTSAFARTGAELGPFDLVLLPIGAYSDHWPDVHMTPEQTVRAHRDLRGTVLLPVHWATFNLGFHRWHEPVDRLCDAVRDTDVRLVLPRPGERVDLARPSRTHDWWTVVGDRGPAG